MLRLAVALVLALSLSTPAAATEQEPVSRPVAGGASIVPGVILHGTGHYLMGESRAARSLLFMQLGGASNLGLILGVAVIVGANPVFAPLLAISAVSAGGMLLGSWLWDALGAMVDEADRGRPASKDPLLVTRVGYRYIYDRIFDFRNFSVFGFELSKGGYGILPELSLAAEDDNFRLRVPAYATLWRPGVDGSGNADGSFLRLIAAGTWRRFFKEGFSVGTAEVALGGRLDAARVDPALRGMFGETTVGVGVNRYRYSGSNVVDDNTVLLASFAFGLYWGDGSGSGGEVKTYYDQRHDDYAAGFKLPALASGPGGHGGFYLKHYFDDDWGVSADIAMGSAYVAEINLLFRRWGAE